MEYNPNIHHRRSVRLKEFDYSRPGEYFVTICTYNRECILGEIVNGELRLNELGRRTEKCWMEIPDHFPYVELDEFVVMPNHIHGLICILENDVGKDLINQILTRKNQFVKPVINFPLMKNPKLILGKIIRYYKARTCKLVHDAGRPEFRWQSSYYEHIIQNNKDLNNIREYILNNPLKWWFDEENPNKKS